jgi:hypothetical protein
MKTKLVAIVALFLAGCGLETMGQDSDSDDSAEPDIGPDEVDQEDLAEDDTADETTPDETDRDVTDIMEDVEPEDAAEAEAEAEDEGGEEDGDAEDGEVVDPCERPDIPTTGLYVFYCFVGDIRSDMALYLQIERGGTPIFPWAEIVACTATSARSMFCEPPLYYNGVYLFNIELDPGIGVGWSCGPGLAETWGTPRVWLDRREQIVTPHANMDGGCNHLFTTPPGP